MAVRGGPEPHRARDGAYLLLIGAALLVIVGSILACTAKFAMVDFKGVYYSARGLLAHADPYSQDAMSRVYRLANGGRATDLPGVQEVITHNVYPPTAFALTLPFAILPIWSASVLWMVVSCSLFILSGWLIWKASAQYAPTMSGVLAGFLLANSVWLFLVGNSAMIATALCIIAVWCFVGRRFELAGVVCLALSLAVKPHNTGLVWLYFLLAGGAYRKRAVQVLAVTVVLGVLSVAWVGRVSPHWLAEMGSNLSAFGVRGGMNDPGPSSAINRDLDPVVDLRSIVSVYRDSPEFYSGVALSVTGMLLLPWIWRTICSDCDSDHTWLALACVSALSMLPVYHRQHDAKLILLALPACAMLWARRDRVGWAALIVTSAAVVLNGDLASALRIVFVKKWLEPITGETGRMLMSTLGRPAQVSLLVMAVFYLWLFMRATRRRSLGTDLSGRVSMPSDE
ncbi:MAG TPA: glycosyltransferase family 87 protein [Terracidiphilus sp.]|nr:glycosyltransferase family 87 protein [Terracidiphilus sp.]